MNSSKMRRETNADNIVNITLEVTKTEREKTLKSTDREIEKAGERKKRREKMGGLWKLK